MDDKPRTIPVLRISNWNVNFENAKSRKVNHKSYGQYVLKQGRGYCRLMSLKDGPAIYGTFIALAALVQSKPAETREGYLTSTGDKTGYPYSFEDMAAMTRIPVKTIEKSISVLVGSSVHWLIGDTMRIPQGYHEDTAVSARYTGIVSYYTESTVITLSEKTPPGRIDYPEQFGALWKMYPGTAGSKKKAFVQCKKAGIGIEEMIPIIETQITFKQQQKKAGEFVSSWPHLHQWIKDERWNDKLNLEAESDHKPKPTEYEIYVRDNLKSSPKPRTFKTEAEAKQKLTAEGYSWSGAEWRKA